MSSGPVGISQGATSSITRSCTWAGAIQEYGLETEEIESNPVEKDFRILVNENLDMSKNSRLTAQAANDFWAASKEV